MTVGFARGVTDVHRKLATRAKAKQAVTSKPFLVITSRGDDVLVARETLSRADWIGPSRWEIELNDNGHDVFLTIQNHIVTRHVIGIFKESSLDGGNVVTIGFFAPIHL